MIDRKIKFRFWDLLECKMMNDTDLEEYTLHSIRDWEGYLMQYIGYEDKNGKEIYEGDVIKYRGHEVSNGKQIRPERTMIVEFIPEKLYQIYCIINMENVEIIGNIYENPKLNEDEI